VSVEQDVLSHRLEQGWSLERIAAEVGVHPATVGRWVAELGLEPARRTRHLARGGLDREMLAGLVEQDPTVSQIATAVDRSATTVRHWLRFHGLQTTRAARRRRAPAGEERDLLAECSTHGEARHVRRADRVRCARCAVDAVSRRRREVKRILVEEAGGACVICGYDRYVGALQFHHLDRSEKRFNLGLKGLARALDNVREEARKCVLVCANCHAEVEADVASVPPSSLHSIRG
jgi:transposase-like protein